MARCSSPLQTTGREEVSFPAVVDTGAKCWDELNFLESLYESTEPRLNMYIYIITVILLKYYSHYLKARAEMFQYES